MNMKPPRLQAVFMVLGCCLMLLSPVPLRGDEAEGPPATLRVLTHNVYMGFQRANEPHHGAWLEWVAGQKPDVVSLQELNGYTAEKLAEDAAAWGHPHSVLLKEDGFPVGLTSRWPIEEVVRLREGFHHGMLRGKVRGVHIYVIHFHPSDWQHRVREAGLLAQDIAALTDDDPKIILAGDFNGFSPEDREYYKQEPALVPFFEMLDQRSERANNLNRGRIDYGGIQAILDQGFVDLQVRFREAGDEFVGTFPSPLVADADHGPDRRLDYIFVSPNLADKVSDFLVLRDEQTALFSDHYPLLAELEL